MSSLPSLKIIPRTPIRRFSIEKTPYVNVVMCGVSGSARPNVARIAEPFGFIVKIIIALMILSAKTRPHIKTTL